MSSWDGPEFDEFRRAYVADLFASLVGCTLTVRCPSCRRVAEVEVQADEHTRGFVCGFCLTEMAVVDVAGPKS